MLRPQQESLDLKALHALILNTQPVAIKRSWIPSSLSGRWRWLVIHHTATVTGNPKSFDQFHRQERNMENGLAYHFLIGNGHGMKDGEVYVGPRWTRQLDGGHVHGDELNRISIGIALVGNFDKQMPTKMQIASLKGLLNYIMEVTHIRKSHVTGHKSMKQQATRCPGTHLPVSKIVKHCNPSQ